MEDILLPPLDIELVLALEKVYPPPVARPSQSDRDIFFEAGKYEVIRFMREQYTRQQEDILNLQG
jgi:hypothetical protein